MTEWLISNQLIDYNCAVKSMEEKIQQIHNNSADELVWLLQHPPLYTAGISATADDIVENYFPYIKQEGVVNTHIMVQDSALYI